MLIFLGLFLFASLLMLLYMYIEAHLNRIILHHIALRGLDEVFEGFRIFFISDIHRRSISPKLIDKLKELPKVDYVVIGGDITERGVPFKRVETNLRVLSQIAPLIFIWGNHDYTVNKNRLIKTLKHYHVQVLENNCMVITRGGRTLNLAGVDDLTYEKDDLNKTLQGKADAPVILFSHNPNIKYRITKDTGIQLVVSGHTHGGQIRLFGISLKEVGGVKRRSFGKLIISNGYGTTRLPLRFSAKPDTLYLILNRAEKK
ncbi:metallophosphoesterase [Terrilactibacillus tamarindi]|uniref:metallophosphoesterase n=1 Tax=Terrilactibacillus tamarindi TaxID=2599694 RepID=UPI002E3092DA|nr:metallophosphoesterase [Terrilactibacillus tamarindi]